MYQVELEVYQGPFDLLLDLIEKEKIDIWDIPIAYITQQYLEELRHMQTLDLVVGSEFLVLAATLLEIKSSMLLPKNVVEQDADQEEDPRDALVARLLEYKLYKEISSYLRDREESLTGCLTRGWLPDSYAATPIFTNPVGASLEQLVKAFSQVMETAAEEDSPREIERRLSLDDKLEQIVRLLQREREVEFRKLFFRRDRWDIVVTFLAVLELIRQGRVQGTQSGCFGQIDLRYVGFPADGVDQYSLS